MKFSVIESKPVLYNECLLACICLLSILNHHFINNNNNNTQLVTRHMSVNAYSYIYERTESQARTGGLSVTVGFIVQMSFKLFFCVKDRSVR